ncbi:hypothetical protein [Streptomyces albicerus]|uniref:hypothetical protein n=1 Tax=Streptomyces albicerus TaxID=2569859 RepID=UPI00124BBC84|nr:hypothetical protein [Streptomyces albicerus]
MNAVTRVDRKGEVAVADINVSTHHFLAQLASQAEELRQGAEAARRARDEAAARLADFEKRLADSTAALRALRIYTGEASKSPTGDGGAGTASGPESTHALSIEEAILHVLRGEGGLPPLEIARRIEALGVSSSASSIRARLSKSVKQGTLRRDGKSRYSLAVVGSEGTQAS